MRPSCHSNHRFLVSRVTSRSRSASQATCHLSFTRFYSQDRARGVTASSVGMSSSATPSLTHAQRRTLALNSHKISGTGSLPEDSGRKHGNHQGHDEERHSLFGTHEHEHEHGTDAEKVIEALK